MSREPLPHQTSRDYKLRMSELDKSILRTRKALRASKKRVAAAEADIATGRKTRGCSGCVKNGIRVMKLRLDQLRQTRKKVEKGVIKPNDIHRETQRGMALKKASSKKNTRSQGRSKNNRPKADKRNKVAEAQKSEIIDLRKNAVRSRRHP